MNASISNLSPKYKKFLGHAASTGLYLGSLGLAVLLGVQLKENTNNSSFSEGEAIRVGELDLETLPASAYSALQEENARESVPEPEAGPSGAGDARGVVVASKNGEKYYFPNCSGVKRINEENKVFFESPAEAEAKGYTLAANCNP